MIRGICLNVRLVPRGDDATPVLPGEMGSPVLNVLDELVLQLGDRHPDALRVFADRLAVRCLHPLGVLACLHGAIRGGYRHDQSCYYC